MIMTPTNDAPVTVEEADRDRIKAVSLRLLDEMREVARQDGWALAVHGSMSRDLDLVAVPWTDTASHEAALVEAMRAAVACALGGVAIVGAGEDGRTPGAKVKPNGRRCYTLHSTSEQLVESEAGAHPYIDLSVMDFRLAALASAPAGDGVEEMAKALYEAAVTEDGRRSGLAWDATARGKETWLRMARVALARPRAAVGERTVTLDPDFVDEAMQDAWNDICDDTGSHPLDLKHGRGTVLYFHPGHWARTIAMRLSHRLALQSPPAKVEGEPKKESTDG